MRTLVYLCALVTVIVASLAFAAFAQSPSVLPLPADWYPESMAVGADGSFYVGSWRQGAVARVRAGANRADVLVPPASLGLANAQGVLVDPQRATLWVCSGDIGFTTVPSTESALKRYELATGAPLASYAMPDGGYCNDLALDAAGNLYVTDSRHPRVLRLAPGAKSLATWKEDPQLGAPAVFSDSHGAYVGLNGIAVDADGSVFVSLVAAAPYVLRISHAADGSAGRIDRLGAPRELKNVDALRAWKGGRLVLFESNAFGTGSYGGQITLARVIGDRLELRTLAAGLNDSSSGAIVGDRVWFIESKYGLLTHRKDSDGPVPTGVPFDLQSVELPAD